jgi:hypothetical protein
MLQLNLVTHMKTQAFVSTLNFCVIASTAIGAGSSSEIFDRHVEASGGRKAVEKIKSREIAATLTMPALGMTGELLIQAKAPNLYFSRVSIEGVGTFLDGFDGKIAWTDNPMMGGLNERRAPTRCWPNDRRTFIRT